MTTTDTPDLRTRIADAIGPTMRIGLQGAELDGHGGAERIGDWIEWIADALLPVVAAEREAAMRDDLPAFQAKLRLSLAEVRDAAHREVASLLADLTDPDPCRYDHHGYCQAHGWFAIDPTCPHARAKRLAARAARMETP